jgi:hypothetical protein
MRPYRHFCGMVAAASRPPFPSWPGPVERCRQLAGMAAMHQRPALDSKGMDTSAPRRQERR